MAYDIMESYRKMLSAGQFDDNQIFHPDTGMIGRYEDDEEVEAFDTSVEISKREEEEKKHEVGGRGPGDYEIEEKVGHYKRYTQRREHKYTETELAAIRKSCEATIVHDYSDHDEYHMSDEERERDNSLKDIAIKLSGMKRIYRDIVQYINAMRLYMEAWRIVEEKENFLHEQDEFFEMVADGRIYHPRIIKPIYSGKTKYSIDTIIKYVSNPELDPNDIAVTVNNQDYDDVWYRSDEEIAEEMEQLLSPDEVQYITDHADNPEMMYVAETKKKYIVGYDQKQFGRRKKDMSKTDRFKADALHQLLNKIQQNPNNRITDSRYMQYMYSMFEPDEVPEDPLDELRYDGSWRDKAGVELFEILQDEVKMGTRVPNNSFYTYGDVAIKQFRKTMEEAGMNVTQFARLMNQSDEEQKREEYKQSKKENKRIEAQLIARITKMNKSDKFKKLVAKTEKKANTPYSDQE